MNTLVPVRRRRPTAAAHAPRRRPGAAPTAPSVSEGTPLLLCFLPEAAVAVVLTAFCTRVSPHAPDDDPLS